MVSPASEAPDEGRVDSEERHASRTLWFAVPSILAVFISLFAFDRHLDARFGQVTAASSSVERHIEKATAIRRDARKVYVLMLESWLLADSARRARLPTVQTAIDQIGEEGTDFTTLAPLAGPEDPLITRFKDDLSTFSSSVLLSSRAGEGSAGAPALEQAMGKLDLDVSAIMADAARASEQVSEENGRLRTQRAWLQGAFLISIVLTMGGTVVFHQRTRAQARIAEVKRLEQERTTRLQTRFFASMSHDLRTPLVAIRGFASDVEEHAGADEVVRERSRRIHAEAISLLGMINNILDVAQIESGHAQLLFEDIALEEVLSRCVSRCQGLVRDKPVVIELELPSRVPPVRADFVKLQQVFTNLIANAVKFTEKGRVTVRVRFGESAPPGMLVVEVEDPGIGIAPEALALIWKPFQQADVSISRQYGGTGLGLSIVWGIVQLHRGSIEVRSTPGVGSTFRVLLPLGADVSVAQVAGVSAPSTSDGAPPTQGKARGA
jgi:signal transduction histidine kinase